MAFRPRKGGIAQCANNGETRSRTTPIADHADAASEALRRFVGAHLVGGE